jgi:hypothetical protein
MTVGLSALVAIANNFQVAWQLLQCFPTDRKTQRYNLFLVLQRVLLIYHSSQFLNVDVDSLTFQILTQVNLDK